MKKLDRNELEILAAGQLCHTAGLACGASLGWPIGTLIFGPSCIGLSIACFTT